jgi:hypothetical protein
MGMTKAGQEHINDVHRRRLRGRQKHPNISGGLVNDKEVSRKSVVRHDNPIGVFIRPREVRGRRPHESEIHVKPATAFPRPFGGPKSRLLLNLSLFLPINKSKRVIVKARGDTQDVAREKIQLILARRPESEHP